jgi:hypothetical protein
MFFISLHKITKMGKILAIFAIFWQVVVLNGVKNSNLDVNFTYLLFLVKER